MAWGSMEVRDQRVRFVLAAHAGDRTLSELCHEFDISRPTGYAWLSRYRAGGLEAVAERSRRPRSSPTRTPEAIEHRIAALRRQRPDWGARKLAVLLSREGILLPAQTLHGILLRLQLVRPDDRRQPAVKRFEREHPNELWQMDFKSPKGWGDQVGPLSVVDDASRYVVALARTGSSRGTAVRAQLETTFAAFGLPDAMLMDHGCPWWNRQSRAGWTQLSVWLMKQDIRLHFSGVRHPQTQGKVERFHGALEMARRRRGLPEPELRQLWLDDFRHEYNEVRPHEALAMKTPASRWTPSRRAFNPNPPEWQYPQGAEVMRLEKTGQLTLDRRRWQVAGALAGERVQLTRIDNRILLHFRNTLIREIDLGGRTSTSVEVRPPRSAL